jgi:outer membrane protein OmpA-like peptidoglycan-associated protein
MAAAIGVLGLVVLLTAVYWWTTRQEPVVVVEPVPVTTTQVAAPEVIEVPSSLTVEREDTTIRLSGMVKTASEREALVAAVTDSGFEAEDAITVSPTVIDSDTRLLALLLPPVLNGTGEALDPVEEEEIGNAIDAAKAAGLTVEDETTVRVLSEAVQIVALQEEINQIFELARTIEGQKPNFDVSIDELSPGATATLDRVSVAMRRYPLPSADIIGHTDSTGSAATNLELSEQRAQVVLDYLTGAGIDASRLTATGEGENQPIADNSDEAGRAENRRVDFIVKSRQS